MLTSAFYFLAFVTIFCAIMVVVSKNPVHSVLFLVLAFFGISANYIFMLDATFVGIVNIIVYAGAIMVLFLYVIMLMNLNAEIEPVKSNLFKISGAIAGGALLLIIAAVIKQVNLEVVNNKMFTNENIPIESGATKVVMLGIFLDVYGANQTQRAETITVAFDLVFANGYRHHFSSVQLVQL